MEVMDQMEEGAEEFIIPTPLDENDHQVMVRKCEIRRKRIVVVGDVETLNLKEAVALLAPTQSHRARANVMKLKTGQYVGVRSADLSNFVIVNPTSDGDIRWLIRDKPDFRHDVRDIYLVDGVRIRRNTVDLTESGSGN